MDPDGTALWRTDMKKGDWIWIAAVLGAAAVLFTIHMAYQGTGSADVAVVTVDGEEVSFTPTEFAILRLLMGDPGTVYLKYWAVHI